MSSRGGLCRRSAASAKAYVVNANICVKIINLSTLKLEFKTDEKLGFVTDITVVHQFWRVESFHTNFKSYSRHVPVLCFSFKVFVCKIRLRT